MGGDTDDTTTRSAFDAIMDSIDGPAYVVTSSAHGEHAGCYVGFASQCSIAPPRFAVWLSKLNRTYRIASDARTLVVHVLRARDTAIARWFAGVTGDEVDKFAAVRWHPGPDGCPVVEGLDWFAGSIVDQVDAGDHVAFVVAPGDGECTQAAEAALTSDDLGAVEAGHPPDER